MTKQFKPNLIPNNPKDGSFGVNERNEVIKKNGGPAKYFGILKKDGCRMVFGVSDKVLTRSLKEPKSDLVKERFKDFNDLCIKLKISVDAEFYMHGLKFNAIYRFFSKKDVTCESYKDSLTKEFLKDQGSFVDKYDSLTIPFLTTFHPDLKAWVFDAIILDRPDIKGFEERMKEMYTRLSEYAEENEDSLNVFKTIVLPDLNEFGELDEIDDFYKDAISCGFEGAVLVHKEHEYKFGRNSLKQGTILKLKEDTVEYDGVVIEVKEGTLVKESAEKTINELGRSVTSKKKGDRKPSGMAKGFVVEYEGHQHLVSLNGFDNESKKELLKNKDKYVGRHLKYTAMPPVKNVPRNAFFKCWRDEK